MLTNITSAAITAADAGRAAAPARARLAPAAALVALVVLFGSVTAYYQTKDKIR